MIALPAEIWHMIATCRTIAANGYYLEYVNPSAYRTLGCVSKMMHIPNAKMIFIKKIVYYNLVKFQLPNGHLHNEIGPALCWGALHLAWYENGILIETNMEPRILSFAASI